MLTYTVDPIGLEDFWGYTKDNVNPANGNMVMQQTDLAISGRGIPVDITRTYNSRKSDTAGMFGYGWHSNIEAQLIDPGNGPIIFIDGDNTRHIFGEKVGGGYIAAGGVYLDLVKNGDSTYTITLTDGTKINFNTAGRIASIVDTNYNTTAYTYTSGKLTTITDASGRTTTIGYGTNGYVSNITYNQAVVNYEYDASNNLTKVTDPASKYITMNYDTNHNITTLTDQRGIATTIGYDTVNDRVSTISRPITIDGAVQTSTTSYSYDIQNLTTTVTDGENKKIQYTYNPSNNVVQVTENPLDPTNMAVTTYAYDNYNNLTKVIAPNTNKVDGTDAYVYSYDVNGNITQVQLPENQSASVSYDSQNNPIENIDFNGNTSNYSYDSDSNQLESTDANIQTSANRYWSNGNLWYSTNLMSAADNLITNSSMELDANSDSWPDNWTKITESGKTATYAWSGTAKYGNKSISISNPTGWAVASSDYIPATVNDKFIVSGYVKTSNITGSSLIKVDFYNSTDVWIGQKASYELKGTHDWTRVQAVIDNIPAGTAKIRVSVGMNAGTGTAYFDGMQLEKGTVLSSYNLIDNSSFERTTNNLPDNWVTSGNFTSNDIIDTSERHIGANSMKITGESGKDKFITQHINISGDSNTKLTLSGWSKQVGSNETGSYLMQVAIHYTNGTTDWLGNNFSRVEDGWQHVAAKIEPTSTFDWIEVYYSYYDQTGTAWFDAPRLEVGSSHTFNNYDVYNNYVTSVNDPMGNVSSFTYDAFGNMLTAKDPKNQTTLIPMTVVTY
ncbi:MAG: DUF6531 domain-containing protein [Sedimentibacter sp.]